MIYLFTLISLVHCVYYCDSIPGRTIHGPSPIVRRTDKVHIKTIPPDALFVFLFEQHRIPVFYVITIIVDSVSRYKDNIRVQTV